MKPVFRYLSAEEANTATVEKNSDVPGENAVASETDTVIPRGCVMTMQKRSRIMVVDDEPDIVLLLAEYLAKEGFTVLTANNGAEAIEKVMDHPVDLTILDVAMPEMNGIETLSRMKSLKPHLPVIMITAFRDADKVLEAFRLGAYDCICKPFDFDYLRTSIIGSLLE
jgi:DNA-binding NtrC family response regulator